MEEWNNGFNGTLSILYKKTSTGFNPPFQNSSIPKFQSIPYGYKPVKVHESFKQRLFRAAGFHLTWAGVLYI
jgi:hypothetical protein